VHEIVGSECEIHTFDCTVSLARATNKPEYVHYHEWCLGDAQSVSLNPLSRLGSWILGGLNGQVRSMAEVVAELGHEGRTVDLFKIDCEGCEFAGADGPSPLWEQLTDSGVAPKQILIELHAGTTQKPRSHAERLMEHFESRGYVAFSKEANFAYSAGRKQCIEYSFIKLEPSFFE
jgi:hypothetical protein